MAAMAPGAQLWVETTDPLATLDIPAFCADDGHRVVQVVALPGAHRFLLERKR